jgi:hypothetical protein
MSPLCQVGCVVDKIAHAFPKGRETFVVCLSSLPAYNISAGRTTHTYKTLLVRKHAGEEGLSISIEE